MALSHHRFDSVIHRQWAWLLAGCFGLVVLKADAARSAPLPPGFSAADAAAASLAVFQTGNTYDVRRSTWRAEVVELAAAIPTGPNRWQDHPPSSDHWGDFARLACWPAGENPSQGFRTTIVVPDDVRDAALCLDRQPSHKIYINGTLVGHYKAIAATPPALQKYSDLGRYFHKGNNCIAIEAETFSRWGPMKSLLLEGAVRCNNGQIIRILTDARWKAAYQPAAGWTEPRFDDSGWRRVVSKGKPAAGYGPLNHVFYLNPPYYGPIDLAPAVRGRYFFYDAGKPLEIPVSVLPNAALPVCDVAWRLDDAETGHPAQQGLLAERHDSRELFAGRLKTSVARPGVYDLSIELRRGGEVVESRVEEIAVIGKIPQREVAGKTLTDGLDLELSDEIDCADPNSPYPVFSQTYQGREAPSRIVKGPAGVYREADAKIYSWFGLGVKLAHPGQPHLVEIEVPDDKVRVMSVRVVESGGLYVSNDGTGRRGWALAGPGIYTGLDGRLTNKMRKLSFIIFPKVPVTGFLFTTQKEDQPAAAGKMRIWRITNDLPALKIGSRDYRLTGQHTERPGTLPQTFFTGPDHYKFIEDFASAYAHRGFYKDWYQTCENAIKYMRFCGENMLIDGIYMYYPWNEGFWDNKEEANGHELFARMLNANGMKMVLGVEYACDENTLAGQRASQTEVAAGEPTLYSVSKEGKLAKNWCNTADTLLPEVAGSFLAKVRQLAELYGQTPGIAGVAFQVNHGWGPAVTYQVVSTSEPLDWGYGDGIIRMFEKDTSLCVPGGPTDPKRFSIRYEWLMAHAREKWVAWRNRKVHDLNDAAAAIVRQANPAWKSFLFGNINLWHDADAAVPPRERLRHDSYDPALYAGDPTIRFGVNYFRAIRAYSPTRRAYYEDPAMIRPSDESAAFVEDGFFEVTMSPKNFYYDTMLVCDFVVPPERDFLRAFNGIMRYATPQIMAQTWIDAEWFSGSEQERREFNRALRVLPPGPYATLAGNGLDRNLVVRAVERGGVTYFYVLNPSLWPVDVTLNLKPGLPLTDLTLGTAVPKIQDAARLALKPYEMISLSLAGGLSSLVSARADVAAGSAEEVRRVAQEKLTLYRLAAKLPHDRLAECLRYLGLRKSAEQAAEEVDAILATGSRGDYLQVVNLTSSTAAGMLENVLQALKTYQAEFVRP